MSVLISTSTALHKMLNFQPQISKYGKEIESKGWKQSLRPDAEPVWLLELLNRTHMHYLAVSSKVPRCQVLFGTPVLEQAQQSLRAWLKGKKRAESITADEPERIIVETCSEEMSEGKVQSGWWSVVQLAPGISGEELVSQGM